jgi:hypothetical protein
MEWLLLAPYTLGRTAQLPLATAVSISVMAGGALAATAANTTARFCAIVHRGPRSGPAITRTCVAPSLAL